MVTGNNRPGSVWLVWDPVLEIHQSAAPLFSSYRPHANVRLAKCFLTMVVLTRPPGCVQVQPECLRSRWQPSSSKHGDISHHLRDWTMRTEWGCTEERQVRGGHVPHSSSYLGKNNAPRWPHRLLYVFGWLKPNCYANEDDVPWWWVGKILDQDKRQQARKCRGSIFTIKIPDEMKVMIKIRTRLNWVKNK